MKNTFIGLIAIVVLASSCGTSLNLPAERQALFDLRDQQFQPQYDKLRQVRNNIQIQGRQLSPAEEAFLQRMNTLDAQFVEWESELYQLDESLPRKEAREKLEAAKAGFSALMDSTEAMFRGYPFQ